MDQSAVIEEVREKLYRQQKTRGRCSRQDFFAGWNAALRYIAGQSIALQAVPSDRGR